MYSNIPKGVVMAVFGISEGSSGIFWYTLTTSSGFKKMVDSFKVVVKFCMCGIGYLSGVVA